MLSHDGDESTLTSPGAGRSNCTVTVSVDVGIERSSAVDRLPPKDACQSHQHQDNSSPDMAGDNGLLECPMCDFAVLSTDDYILQLHFEQVHTTDSPFKIEDDQEPPLPSAKRKHVTDTPSSDDEEGTVTCPEPDCGELVLLADFNDHLDFHAAESLSFDETTGRYHSQHPSATMHNLATQSHSACSGSTLGEHDSSSKSHKHEHKKHGHRPRSNTASSEKSTLSRSILSFNPFVKLDKSVRPPNKSARLGVSCLIR